MLIFRDGRKQEISNYAIMGQVVYVFDEHTKKIPLTDLFRCKRNGKGLSTIVVWNLRFLSRLP